MGKTAEASETDSMALGTNAKAFGENSVALGRNATASGTGALSGGVNSSAGTVATALGGLANASGNASTAVGRESTASNVNATAVGMLANAGGFEGTAVGKSAVASANGTTAVGRGANAGGYQSTSVGYAATATHDNSTALGKNATTSAASQVMIGGAGSSVAVGDIDASNAAQTGTEYIVTVDDNGTLGKQEIAAALSRASLAALAPSAVSDTAFNALDSRVAGLESQVASLYDLAETNRRGVREANEGVAMALAMESPAIPAGASFAMSGGVGHYKGRTSLAMAVSAAVSEMSSISAGLGVGANSGEVGARAGFQFAW
ncbi:MAG: YadA-like family protein [Novosphingobium sp.]|nr:YadA-like family protein [Novosphingobium sp.]